MRKPDIRIISESVLLTLVLFFLFAGSAQGAGSIRVVDLGLRDLVYDALTAKLYGTRANNLLQIDPESGATVRDIALSGTPARLALDSRHRLWIGLNSENAVQILNLETLSSEDKIVLSPPAQGAFAILDISPSIADPATAAVSTEKDVFGRAYLMRRGALLPDSVSGSHLTLTGGYVFGETPDGIYRYAIQPSGLGSAVRVGAPTFNALEGPLNIGNFVVAGTRVYHSSGEEFEFVSGQTIQANPNYPASSVAFSKDEDALYYLFRTPPSLHRYARESHLHTGRFDLPETGVHLTVWSTNRAAFHTASELYILETDKLFEPADLSIQLRVSRTNVQVGDVISCTLVVGNKGPGAALGVSWSASISSNGLIISPAQSTGRFLTNLIPTLGAGQSKDVASFAVLALSPGSLTGSLSIVSGTADPNTNDNAAVSTIFVAPLNPGASVVPFNFAASTIAVDRFSERLFVSSAGHLLVYDPRREEFTATVPIGSNARQLAFSPVEPVMLLSYGTTPGGVTRLDSSTFQVTSLSVVPQPLGTVADIAVSPVLSGLAGNPYVAISDSSAIYFGGASLPAAPGFIEFSEDGSRLYHVNLGSCALETFRVTTNIFHPVPFELESTQPGLDCADFRVNGGLLYFESGLIYNPFTKQNVGRVPGLALLSYVLPGEDGILNVLTRVNGLWRVRRLHPTTFEEISSIEIGALPSGETVQEAVILRNKLAFRTTSSVYVVSLETNLDPSALRLAASQGAAGEVSLRFASVQGATYRIEQSTQLAPATWSVLQDNLAGTGLTVQVNVPASGKIQFYRVLETK